jgi:hypothetical protein
VGQAVKQPTWTTLALELLIGREDFMTTVQVAREIGATYNQACAALVHLRKRHAIDCVIERDGVAWWFATPDYDDRLLTHDERKPETKPRKRRSGLKRGKA